MCINRVDYKEIVQQHGYPVASSSNGQNFIFRKTLDQIHDQFKNIIGTNDTARKEICLKEYFTISVVTMGVFGMLILKRINILEMIK